jgi:hypothetical protein
MKSFRKASGNTQFQQRKRYRFRSGVAMKSRGARPFLVVKMKNRRPEKQETISRFPTQNMLLNRRDLSPAADSKG